MMAATPRMVLRTRQDSGRPEAGRSLAFAERATAHPPERGQKECEGHPQLPFLSNVVRKARVVKLLLLMTLQYGVTVAAGSLRVPVGTDNCHVAT